MSISSTGSEHGKVNGDARTSADVSDTGGGVGGGGKVFLKVE